MRTMTVMVKDLWIPTLGLNDYHHYQYHHPGICSEQKSISAPIGENGLNPDRTTSKKEILVIWTNEDSELHNVTLTMELTVAISLQHSHSPFLLRNWEYSTHLTAIQTTRDVKVQKRVRPYLTYLISTRISTKQTSSICDSERRSGIRAQAFTMVDADPDVMEFRICRS